MNLGGKTSPLQSPPRLLCASTTTNSLTTICMVWQSSSSTSSLGRTKLAAACPRGGEREMEIVDLVGGKLPALTHATPHHALTRITLDSHAGSPEGQIVAHAAHGTIEAKNVVGAFFPSIEIGWTIQDLAGRTDHLHLRCCRWTIAYSKRGVTAHRI